MVDWFVEFNVPSTARGHLRRKIRKAVGRLVGWLVGWFVEFNVPVNRAGSPQEEKSGR